VQRRRQHDTMHAFIATRASNSKQTPASTPHNQLHPAPTLFTWCCQALRSHNIHCAPSALTKLPHRFTPDSSHDHQPPTTGNQHKLAALSVRDTQPLPGMRQIVSGFAWCCITPQQRCIFHAMRAAVCRHEFRTPNPAPAQILPVLPPRLSAQATISMLQMYCNAEPNIPHCSQWRCEHPVHYSDTCCQHSPLAPNMHPHVQSSSFKSGQPPLIDQVKCGVSGT
jgi:hypothetical protein